MLSEIFCLGKYSYSGLLSTSWFVIHVMGIRRASHHCRVC